MQFTVNFHGCKNGIFLTKKCDSFIIFAPNIDRGYMLELGGSNEYPQSISVLEQI